MINIELIVANLIKMVGQKNELVDDCYFVVQMIYQQGAERQLM